MLFGEGLVLLTVLAGGFLGVRAFVWKLKESKARTDVAFEKATFALQSKSYLELDNCLALYGNRLPRRLRNHMSMRRDELYLNENIH